MFDPSSRYAPIPTATFALAEPDGTTRTVTYVRRRFFPPVGGDLTLVEHAVSQGDRLDNLTALYLNDPTQFWRVCDSNLVLRPSETTDTLGRVLRIVVPMR
jgi:hypothetical protein